MKRLYKINSWQVLMFLLVEEPSLNHSNAFFGERKREMGLVKPQWRSVQDVKCTTLHITSASAVSQTSHHYLGILSTAGSQAHKRM